jgi:hypothetical protein
MGHIVKLGGYLPASAATGGVRHSTVEPSGAERSLRSFPLTSTFMILGRWPLRPRASHSVVNSLTR